MNFCLSHVHECCSSFLCILSAIPAFQFRGTCSSLMAYIIHIYVFFFACELAQDPIGVLLTPAFILIVEYIFWD